MKENPEQQDLRQKLLPGKLSAEGFLGEDMRSPAEIIQEDVAALARLGTSATELAARMRELTELGQTELGRPVRNGDLEITVTGAMGGIPCPFSDAHRADKRLTQVKNILTGQEAHWSDLNIHMLERHGFCEGRGSFFRLEPADLVKLLMEEKLYSKAEDRDLPDDYA